MTVGLFGLQSGNGLSMTCACGKLTIQVVPVHAELAYLFQIRRSDGKEICEAEPVEAVGQWVKPSVTARAGFQGGIIHIDLDDEPRG